MLSSNVIHSTNIFFLKLLNNIGIFVLLANIFTVEIVGFVGFAITLSTVFENIFSFGYRIKVIKDIKNNSINITKDYVKRIFHFEYILISILTIFFIGYIFFNEFTYEQIFFLFLYYIGTIFFNFSSDVETI